MQFGDRRKKLRDAARLIAVGRAEDSEVTRAELDRLVEDLRAFGAGDDQIAAAVAQVRKGLQDDVFRIHPDNVTAVRLFQAMATQWTMVSLSTLDSVQLRRTGLRYEVLDVVAGGLGLVRDADDFARLQYMEAEALVAWAEAAKR